MGLLGKKFLTNRLNHMPDSVFTPSNLTFGLGIMGVIFTSFIYFRKPQEDMDKKQAVNDVEMNSKASILAQKELESKASILAQQVQWEKEANERRFKEMGDSLISATTLAQNHIHTIDVRVTNLTDVVNGMNLSLVTEITKLTAIIDERIPKRD